MRKKTKALLCTLGIYQVIAAERLVYFIKIIVNI